MKTKMKIKITITMTITITMKTIMTTIITIRITMEQTNIMKIHIVIRISTKLIIIFIVSIRMGIVISFPNRLLTCGWIRYAQWGLLLGKLLRLLIKFGIYELQELWMIFLMYSVIRYSYINVIQVKNTKKKHKHNNK